MKRTLSKMIALSALALTMAGIIHYDLSHFLSLSSLQENLQHLRSLYALHPWQTMGIFVALYIISTTLSIPGATVLTLGAGALFGKWTGTVVVSFASTIGATLAFLMARFFLRDCVQKHFGEKLAAINRGVEQEGARYLFALRLVPLFPFFLINLTMGLTPIPTRTFFWVSQVGMLAGTFVYVNAGEEISQLSSLEQILSPSLVVAFSLLGLFPLLAKRLLGRLKTRRLYRCHGFKRPRRFDYDLLAIGAGSGGLVTCYIASALKAKAALVERHKMGGDCLNTGCVPSKALIKSAQVIHQARQGKKYGFTGEPQVDFPRIMERVQEVIGQVAPHDSVERYRQLGVECWQGTARILSPWQVEVEKKCLTVRSIVIATGARPFIPPIPGLEGVDYLTSDNLWGLRKLPQKLAVLGGGAMGLEMAQSFQRLGSQVTVVEMAPRIMTKEDPEVTCLLEKVLRAEGLTILTGHRALEIKQGQPFHQLRCQGSQGQSVVDFDHILIAVGRKANTQGLGLEELGVELAPQGAVHVNQYLQTNYPNIYACGDITGHYQLTHMAAHQAWYCAVNALLGGIKKFAVDYSAVPWATYTDPEVATVGRMEESLKAEGVPHQVISYDLSDLDRAITDGQNCGLVKVCVVPGKDRILGATIIGPRASDYIIEFISAMKHGLGLNKILGTIHPYPTMAEANKYLAGQWRQLHQPQRVLAMLERIFRWQRGS